VPKPKLTEVQEATVELIRNTATSLWDVSEVADSTQTVTADDWELARVACSHLLLALEHPPAPSPLERKADGNVKAQA
jgi:hypothetical protein